MKKFLFIVLSVLNFSISVQAATLEVKLSPEELSSRFGVFVPDKDSLGTTTDGIQEALNAAKTSEGGLVQLDCNTTYTLTPKNGAWVNMVDMRNVTIQGCGRGSSIIKAHGDFRDLDFSVFGIRGTGVKTSGMLSFENFTLDIHNTCNAGDCNNSGSSKWDEAFNVSGQGDHIDWKYLNIIMTVNENPNITEISSVRVIHIACDDPGDLDKSKCWDMEISGNRIEASNRHVEILRGNNIDVLNNHFENSKDPNVSPAGRFILKYGSSEGLRVAGNEFDFSFPASFNENRAAQGVFLKNGVNTFKPGFSAKVVGNDFMNMNHVSSGIFFEGYDGAIVSDNNMWCWDQATCNPYGVYFSAKDCIEPCNNGNLITNNNFMFGGSSGDRWAGPIHFNGNHPTGQTSCSNIIKHNIFWQASEANDGIRGDAIGLISKKACNVIDDNLSINNSTKVGLRHSPGGL